MNSVRFGWISETRRLALRSLVAHEVAEWSRAWWVQHSAAEVDVQASERSGPRIKESLPFVCSNECGSLALFLGRIGAETIGRYLVGGLGEEDAGWSQQIGEDALEDLVARICHRAGMATPSGLTKMAAAVDLTQARLGAYAMTLSLGRLQFDLSIDRQLADRLAPPRAIQKGGLMPRREALDDVRVRINAMINFGATSVAHLSDLCVGEILMGDRGLDESLAICLDGHDPVAIGYMRRLDSRRAVLLDESSNKEKVTS